jgi:uncharacterized protein YcbX
MEIGYGSPVRIDAIWRYPVKSLGGERLESADVDERGIEFDRAWSIFDPATDLTLTARREPRLLFLTATIVDGRPRITTEQGDDLSSDEALGAWLGRPVELRSVSDGPGTFENPVDVDNETDWIQWQSAGLSFHDGRSTVSFVSRSSMRVWDERRFRINLVVDEPGDDDAIGQLSVGSAALTVRKPIERCVMVTRAQPGIERDLQVLKTIIRERDNKLGVGATVSQSGRIAVGDDVRQITA